MVYEELPKYYYDETLYVTSGSYPLPPLQEKKTFPMPENENIPKMTTIPVKPINRRISMLRRSHNR